MSILEKSQITVIRGQHGHARKTDLYRRRNPRICGFRGASDRSRDTVGSRIDRPKRYSAVRGNRFLSSSALFVEGCAEENYISPESVGFNLLTVEETTCS
jgi:hypothetical protein